MYSTRYMHYKFTVLITSVQTQPYYSFFFNFIIFLQKETFFISIKILHILYTYNKIIFCQIIFEN